MAQMYESGLFSELGDLLGHDPTFYEESDVSSYHGDITKHSYSTSSLYDNYNQDNAKVLEPLSSSPVHSDTTEMDNLLSEGNMLLDQLMAENGLDLLTAPVELADVDELVASEVKFNSIPFDNNSVNDLFAQFYEPTNELYQQTPESPVSTLPSEPSSPVDLFDLELAASAVSEPTALVTNESSAATDELDDLLSSLLDEGHAPQSSSFDDQFICSPASSSGSDCSYYGNGSEYSNDLEEDNSSSYSLSPAPEKIKSPKKKKSSTPYSKLPANRKEKKKQQNKEAAIRYRQKKKGETQVLADEEATLQEKNDTLKAEVLNLEREIMCMKELLSDVFNVHSI